MVKENIYFNSVKKDAYENITDQQLLDHYYNSGNNEWLGRLLERYTLLLLGVCMKYLKNEDAAKDAAQQIFLKVISEVKKYKVEYFKSWLYMVARNYCLMQLRSTHGKPQACINENMQFATQESDLESKIENDRLLTCIDICLLQLEQGQKTCVTLFYHQKKSYTEIAALTGFTPMQVKSYIQNGKRNLKILVEKMMKS